MSRQRFRLTFQVLHSDHIQDIQGQPLCPECFNELLPSLAKLTADKYEGTVARRDEVGYRSLHCSCAGACQNGDLSFCLKNLLQPFVDTLSIAG